MSYVLWPIIQTKELIALAYRTYLYHVKCTIVQYPSECWWNIKVNIRIPSVVTYNASELEISGALKAFNYSVTDGVLNFLLKDCATVLSSIATPHF